MRTSAPVISVRIYGEFWDSQIYMGRLILWGMDGSVTTINWEGFVKRERSYIEPRLHLPFTCAFLRSDFIYSSAFKSIFGDDEFKSLLRDKFTACSLLAPIETDLSQMEEYSRTVNNKFPFPHADSSIYLKHLFVAGQDGLFCAPLTGPAAQRAVIATPEKRWDAYCTGISSKYLLLGLSAGSEGLYSSRALGDSDPEQISSRHTTASDWVNGSLYGSSQFGGGYLADLTWEGVEFSDVDGYMEDGGERPRSVLSYRYNEEKFATSELSVHEIGEEELFGESRNRIRSWGASDRILGLRGGRLHALKMQFRKDSTVYSEPEFDRLFREGAPLPDSTRLISAQTGVFGTVLEFDSGLFVIDTLNDVWEFSRDPVRWRMFPRSKFYENQLHVIYDEYIDILSFNQDFLADQETKVTGSYRRMERDAKPL